MKKEKHEGIIAQIILSIILGGLIGFFPFSSINMNIRIGITVIIYLISMGVWVILYNQMIILEKLK